MDKIVSNFYLIKVGGKPSYVGYTNRSIETRFKEHKRDKDFGDEYVSIENLGNLEYDFTWDLGLINQYAREVSDKETELILTYGTQDSEWQKGLGFNIGGQTWSKVKYFVKTNRNNPGFRGMPEGDILNVIEYQRQMTTYLRNVINNTNPSESNRLKSVIKNTNPPEDNRIKRVITHTKPKEDNNLRSAIYGTKPPEDIRLKSVVYSTKPPEYIRIKSLIDHTKNPEDNRLRFLIYGTKHPEDIRIKSVISNTKHRVENKKNL